MAAMDMKMALNAEILAQGHSENAHHRPTPTAHAVAKTTHVANKSTTEWNVGTGTFQEHWPSHLPKPPSMRRLKDDEVAAQNPNAPRVIVFNANTHEGSSIVRVLSERGLCVVAVVRVITSRNAKNLTKLKNVIVKVADLNNEEAVIMAAQGCQQAFLVTKYWERFENPIEEQIAKVVLMASVKVGIQRLVLATFEDTAELRRRNRKSQLIPTVDGRIFPSFDAMESIHIMAKAVGVQMTHMMTSYLDEANSKKSLILIRGENGRIKTQEHVQEVKQPNN